MTFYQIGAPEVNQASLWYSIPPGIGSPLEDDSNIIEGGSDPAGETPLQTVIDRITEHLTEASFAVITEKTLTLNLEQPLFEDEGLDDDTEDPQLFDLQTISINVTLTTYQREGTLPLQFHFRSLDEFRGFRTSFNARLQTRNFTLYNTKNQPKAQSRSCFCCCFQHSPEEVAPKTYEWHYRSHG